MFAAGLRLRRRSPASIRSVLCYRWLYLVNTKRAGDLYASMLFSLARRAPLPVGEASPRALTISETSQVGG
jgi:hypothetical protein